jgi:hypothetical protein
MANEAVAGKRKAQYWYTATAATASSLLVRRNVYCLDPTGSANHDDLSRTILQILAAELAMGQKERSLLPNRLLLELLMRG